MKKDRTISLHRQALEADPPIKHAKIILGCKSCYYQYIAYTALDRARELEEKVGYGNMTCRTRFQHM
ncbi:MAG: hypothetical protein R3F36_12085 [Candidatus Competibacteraceae bacterium]